VNALGVTRWLETTSRTRRRDLAWGGLALGASLFAGLLSDLQLREMSAVGGLLIIGVGLKLLNIRDVKVADYLPAILVAPLLVAAVVRIKEALAL